MPPTRLLAGYHFTLDELRELVFVAAGAATGPLMKDNPDYEFPNERVTEAIEIVLAEYGIGV